MKVRTWVETSQEVEVDVSLDDVMAEISGLEAPLRKQEALRLLSMCIGALQRVPDAIAEELSAEQRKLIADALRKDAERYLPDNLNSATTARP
jgi:hypothetical protein